MHKYKLLGRKGEGTFSEVLKAQSLKTSRFMAIKCMKHVFESLEQVNSLREIQALRRLSPHPNIVKLHEVLFDQPTGRLALVFELMDCNIYELIKGRTHYLAEESVRIYLYQLMKAVDHMHRHGIFHR
jgi:renal tumor antigen